MLAESESAPPDGFIIEHHTAGGHNANPVGPLRQGCARPAHLRRRRTKPIWPRSGRSDIPFWLAGGYGSRAKLQEALAAGANGVQVGTVFALAEESGMKPEYRSAILAAIKDGVDDADLVRTTIFSPTGFSFKVVQLPRHALRTTMSMPTGGASATSACYSSAASASRTKHGERTLFQRCPAGPIDTYVKQRGLERNTDERRCLCNGLLSCVGLGQVKEIQGELVEEPAIVTLGNHLDGVRRLSRQGQTHYHVEDVVADILG